MLSRLPDETHIVAGDRPEAFVSAAADADVILSWFQGRELLQEVFRMAPQARWIHSSSVGLDTLLFPELIASPVILTNARGPYSASLGEFAIAAMLFFAKDLRRMVRSQGAGHWDPFDVEMLEGKVAGLLGFGSIGREVARRARGLGMRVLAVRRQPRLYNMDPLVDREYAPEHRNEVLAGSDYVVLTTPLTPETRGMIGEAELAVMKPGAVLINIGRGPVVDEAALIRALEEHRIRGAALDVFDQEPLPEGHPFWRMENVLLSPHAADHTAGWLDRSMELFIENFKRFTKGEPLLNVVDKQRGY